MCVHAYTFIVCLLVRLIPRLFVGGDLSSPPTISCVSESQCKSLICTHTHIQSAHAHTHENVHSHTHTYKYTRTQTVNMNIICTHMYVHLASQSYATHTLSMLDTNIMDDCTYILEMWIISVCYVIPLQVFVYFRIPD